jgi:esterase/lipase superfamily enzyme
VGRVIFAAPDVDLDVLVEKLPSVHDLAIDGVAITVTDHDAALEMGQALMGGHVRAGELAVLDDPRVRDELERLPRLEFINVSAAKGARGFDIAGHHYWHAHPWAASDIIMLLRTALAPHERGLTPTDTPRVWQLPPGYPDRVRDSARRALGSTW